jgi:hypothetical protein
LKPGKKSEERLGGDAITPFSNRSQPSVIVIPPVHFFVPAGSDNSLVG